MRVGIAQISPGHIDRVAELLNRSRPDLLLLPEYTLFDPTGLRREEVYERATTLEDYVGRLSRLAKITGGYVAGAFLERGPSGRVYNTTALVDPSGAVVGTYRKTHLFDAYSYRESAVVEAGGELSRVFDVRGVKVAFAVCFELRFPEVFRSLALRGAELAAVPAAWYGGPLKEETLRVLSRARAIENGMYVVVSSLWGSRFVGRSLAVDPYGVVVVDLGTGERYVEVELDTSLVREARETVPTLRLRRPELYTI